jgi:glycine/D-amino acid oxidase-like deaminating enzyme
MIEERFDAIVVGAGMAGNACALTLAQRGLKVLQEGHFGVPGGRLITSGERRALQRATSRRPSSRVAYRGPVFALLRSSSARGPGRPRCRRRACSRADRSSSWAGSGRDVRGPRTREVERFPGDGFRVDQTGQMIVEPAHDPVQFGCDQFGRTAHGVHEDQYLRGLFLRESL